jgi:hypothetical protein
MPQLLIDSTRLVSRLMAGRAPTGIDRVCLAYVRRYAAVSRLVLRRGRLGVVLPRAASQRLFSLLLERGEGLSARVADVVAESDRTRGESIGRSSRVLLNLGHSGPEQPQYGQWLRRQQLRPIFMVHDLIPLTHPEYCRPAEQARHARRIQTILTTAVGVVTNSHSTLDELSTYAADRGLPMPPAMAAPLASVDLSKETGRRPLDGPYFVVVGTIEPRKNHLLILQVWRRLVERLGEKAPRLVVIGQRGWECENVLDLLERCETLRGFVIGLPVRACAALLVLLALGVPGVSSAQEARGLSGRLIVGYQGWFGCPNDLADNKLWQHWFAKDVRPELLTVDLLPSLRDIKPQDLCDTGLPRADGHGTIKLFSSQNPNVVAAHFRMMREHGIDGAAAQRFVSELPDPVKKSRHDHMLGNVRAAAEAAGRVFFVSYDITGTNPKTVMDDVRKDWRYLNETLRVTQSPAYLRDHGKPVLELWGFGIGDRPGSASDVKALIDDLKSGRNGLAAATVVGGVPTQWRTLQGDSKTEPQWAETFRSYDVISPWSVGRFTDEATADAFSREFVEPDLAETRRLGLLYMPVAFPGFSWSNLMRNRNQPNLAILNKIPRKCGQFLWQQVGNLVRAHPDSIYVAMFDEADEGTAIFPVATSPGELPAGIKMVYLDQDGCAAPQDWYLRTAGAAAQYLRESKVPPRQLSSVIEP